MGLLKKDVHAMMLDQKTPAQLNVFPPLGHTSVAKPTAQGSSIESFYGPYMDMLYGNNPPAGQYLFCMECLPVYSYGVLYIETFTSACPSAAKTATAQEWMGMIYKYIHYVYIYIYMCCFHIPCLSAKCYAHTCRHVCVYTCV